ncbi:MAG TPA: nucleotidyltransferase family protein [Burkholderiales bacterium]|nr:nucleotidyltransferase family protein [Burkholderiales bacterium]
MNVEQSIVGILLAAGAGTRFGGGKLVHPLDDGVAIAVHAARNLITAGLHVVAVVRPADPQLANMLKAEGCTVTPCAESEQGMGHTLAHGIATSADAAGWVVALADMPHIQPATIAAVAAAIKEGALIAAPRYHGVRAHPVGFAASLSDELLDLTGDSGARALLQRHASDVRLIETDDPGVMLDIDRKSDLGRLR